ncbi:VOC family protein [Streptomyces sp. NPDC060194]|uniref:VOC family protein n=1 Tax=Streptomyces sp. NPDC060194 TaxID=3347069 RepID=UPI0036548566
MLRIGSIAWNVSDTGRASAFWSGALGYTARPDRSEVLSPPDGAGPQLWLDADDRTHLDLHTDSADEQRVEVERLLALGATRVEWEYPPGADFVVLADPDGNLFCVVDTSAE